MVFVCLSVIEISLNFESSKNTTANDVWLKYVIGNTILLVFQMN